MKSVWPIANIFLPLALEFEPFCCYLVEIPNNANVFWQISRICSHIQLHFSKGLFGLIGFIWLVLGFCFTVKLQHFLIHRKGKANE